MPTPSELDNGQPLGNRDSGKGSKVRNRPAPLTLVVLCVGLAVTGLLTWVTYSINVNNEDRLLRLETCQAATILAGAVPTIQTPLASAVEITGAVGHLAAHSAQIGRSGLPESQRAISALGTPQRNSETQGMTET